MLTSYRREGRSIPLAEIHDFWKKLNLLPFTHGKKEELNLDQEIQILLNTFNRATDEQKLELKRQVQLLGSGTTATTVEPKQKCDTRGRKRKQILKKFDVNQKSTKRDPSAFEYAMHEHTSGSAPTPDVTVRCEQVEPQGMKKSKKSGPKQNMPKLRVYRTRNANPINYIAMFPQFMQTYIQNVTDVAGDGHCGFRVVALHKGLGEDGWQHVRKELAEELIQHRDHYNNALSPFSNTGELLNSVVCEDDNVDVGKWMVMPYMGNVVSSCFKIVVVLLSKEQCLTFFPFRDPIPHKYNEDILVFGYVNSSHFVKIQLSQLCPLPPVSKMWLDHHLPQAKGWAAHYSKRVEYFKSIATPSSTATVEYLD